jgi:N-carbamoyl-L-amino-acid hydrolase
LRIEQGSRLERATLNIGVVNGIQGNRRLQVPVQGEKAHAGSTPMNERVDALVASSKIVLSVEAAGIRYGGFAAVGVLHCEHGSINSVPEETFLTIDLRHPSSKSPGLMEVCIRTDTEKLESSNQRLCIKVDRVWESPAVRFDEIAVQCVRKTAQERLGVSTVAELDSFAGHDSAFTQLRVPTAMIFVPSRDGISHAPEEYTSERTNGGLCVSIKFTSLADSVKARMAFRLSWRLFVYMTSCSQEWDHLPVLDLLRNNAVNGGRHHARRYTTYA